MRVDDRVVALVFAVVLAIGDVVDEQVLPAVFRLVCGELVFGAGDDVFAVGQRVFVGAEGELAARNGGLVLRLLGDRLHFAGGVLAFGELVDHRAGRGARAGDEHGAHAVGVDRCGLQCGQRVFVEVVGDGDLRVGGAERVQLVAYALREGREVARIDAHAAQFRSGHFDGGFHGFFDVVGVDQQRGVLAERRDLRFEGAFLVVMHQGEAVRGGADGLQAVHLRGQQVGGALESAHHGGACGGDRGPFVRAASAHIHARTVLRGGGHAGRGGGDGGIVIQNAQQQRFQQRAFAERAFDLQDRRVREEHLAFAVALDGAGEVEVLQPFDGFRADHLAVGEEFQVVVVEVELLERVEDASLSGGHAVVAAQRQMPGEDLEYALAVGGAVLQACVKHGVFVHVGHECG